MNIADLALSVFARTPVAGQTKTRLIPRLGAVGAARLQAQLIDKALARALSVAPQHTHLWLTGESVTTVWPDGVTVHAQEGADLGARMTHAFATLLPQYATVLLIGTDCPAQTPDDLRQAAQALHSHDVVLQPAHDGGYVLVGLSARVLQQPRWPKMFESIDWGSSAVYQQTEQQLVAISLSHHSLEPKPDLDEPSDYERALERGWVAAV